MEHRAVSIRQLGVLWWCADVEDRSSACDIESRQNKLQLKTLLSLMQLIIKSRR